MTPAAKISPFQFLAKLIGSDFIIASGERVATYARQTFDRLPTGVTDGPDVAFPRGAMMWWAIVL